MANIGTLIAHIGADTSGLNSGLRSSRKQLTDFSDTSRRRVGRLGGALSALKGPILGVAAAFGAWKAISTTISEIVGQTANFEATMVSLRAVTQSTGRDINEVYKAMETQMGGLADAASVASGFLKGLTTTLTVQQINDLTTAIKNASIAMGEDFNVQLPLIIKAIKQLNPAILDNIGVTIRLDQVNKRIREGFYGMGRAINETTQQHAVFVEIMKQTAQFAGQEEAFLGTLKGQWQAFKAALTDTAIVIGQKLLPAINFATKLLKEFTDLLRELDMVEMQRVVIEAKEAMKPPPLTDWERFLINLEQFTYNSLRVLKLFWRQAVNVIWGMARVLFTPFQDLFNVIKRFLELVGTIPESLAQMNIEPSRAALNNLKKALDDAGGDIVDIIKETIDETKVIWEEFDKSIDLRTAQQIANQRRALAQANIEPPVNASVESARQVAAHWEKVWRNASRSGTLAFKEIESNYDSLLVKSETTMEKVSAAHMIGLSDIQARALESLIRDREEFLEQLETRKKLLEIRLAFAEFTPAERQKLEQELMSVNQQIAEFFGATEARAKTSSEIIVGFIRRIADESRFLIEDVFSRTLQGEFKKLSDFFRALYTEITNILARISAQLLVSDIYKLFGLNQPSQKPNVNPFGFLPISNFQHGGIVTQPQLAMVGEVPEAVIPLSKLSDPKFWDEIGGDKSTQNITVNMNVQTPDVAGFKASESQLISRLAVAMSSARRNL